MNEELMDKTKIDEDHYDLTSMIEADPGNPLLYHERGWIRLQKNDLPGALSDYSRANDLDPEYAEVYASRAFAHYLGGSYVEAEEDIVVALSKDPTSGNKLNHLRSLIRRKQANGVGTTLESATQDELSEGNGGQKSRREFLKTAALVGATTAVAISLPGCVPAVLKGEETDIRWGKIIDLKRCVGCKACSIACKAENHTPPGIAYHVVMEREKGKYPYSKREFTPMPCMQCKNSTCIPICPVNATYYRDDGVVVVDYDKCIGCRYCIATCPYGSRSFDYGHFYSEDRSNPWENQPSPEYGQHRKREGRKSPIGNVRKCTNCLHRIYNGIGPSCASACMGNAIFFGDMNDPEAKCMIHGVHLQELLARRNYRILKEETGNQPRVYYLT